LNFLVFSLAVIAIRRTLFGTNIARSVRL